jgi:hypothetical protein
VSLPLPQGYVAVHVAQPSATYVHSVRCSERHRSERLLVRLFVLACACVCVCVLQRACASVCTCVCTIARCCAQVASARGAASCSMHLHAQLCQRAMHKSVVCEQCVKQRIVGLRFRKFFFHVCAQWQTNNSTQAGVAHCKRVLLYSTAARVTVRMGKRVQHALLLTAELLKPSAPSCTRAHR